MPSRLPFAIRWHARPAASSQSTHSGTWLRPCPGAWRSQPRSHGSLPAAAWARPSSAACCACPAAASPPGAWPWAFSWSVSIAPFSNYAASMMRKGTGRGSLGVHDHTKCTVGHTIYASARAREVVHATYPAVARPPPLGRPDLAPCWMLGRSGSLGPWRTRNCCGWTPPRPPCCRPSADCDHRSPRLFGTSAGLVFMVLQTKRHASDGSSGRLTTRMRALRSLCVVCRADEQETVEHTTRVLQAAVIHAER